MHIGRASGGWMGWSQGALQDGGSHSRWAMGKAKRSPFCGSYSVSWFVKPDNAASNVWGVRTGNDEKSLKASPLLGEGWRGTETCPDQRPLGSGGQCQVRLSDPRSRTLQTRQTRPLSPLCRLLCPPASWAFHPPFSSWAGLDRLGASRSSGQLGRGPVQAMTRHSLLPSLPTSLDLHGLPLPFRLSRPLGEAEPFPPAPDSGSLTSFLGLPLGPDPEPSALHTESSQNTPLPATDAETEAQGGLQLSLGSRAQLLYHSVVLPSLAHVTLCFLIHSLKLPLAAGKLGFAGVGIQEK